MPTSLLVGLAAAGAIAGLVALTYQFMVIATTDLRVTRLEAPLRDLGKELDGYTFAVVADLHHRPFVSHAYVDRIATAAREARPDVLLLLGDYGVSFEYVRIGNRRLYRLAAAAVARLVERVRPPDGTLAVLGNHDHYAGAAEVAETLRALGVRVLDNSCVEIRRGEARVLIGGVGDAVEGVVDPGAGCSEFPDDVPRLVLSHNPDGVLALDPSARIDLVLAGHTHGGQIVFPVLGAPVTMSRLCTRLTPSGWVPNPRAALYVSRGVGCQLPVRFRCPPELVIVRLRSAAQQPV